MVILIRILKAFFSRTERTGEVWSGEGELMTRLLRCESPIVRWEDGRSDDLSYQYILQYISVCNYIYNHQYMAWRSSPIVRSSASISSDSDDIRLYTGIRLRWHTGNGERRTTIQRQKSFSGCELTSQRRDIWMPSSFEIQKYPHKYLRRTDQGQKSFPDGCLRWVISRRFECHKWWFL